MQAGFDIQMCGFGKMSVYHGVNECPTDDVKLGSVKAGSSQQYVIATVAVAQIDTTSPYLWIL